MLHAVLFFCSDLFNKHQRSMVMTSDICLTIMYSLLVSCTAALYCLIVLPNCTANFDICLTIMYSLLVSCTAAWYCLIALPNRTADCGVCLTIMYSLLLTCTAWLYC
jgi:hypothetical protein